MIKDILIKDLVLLEKNPRRISTPQFESLCQSLQDDPDFLQERPILVNLVDGKYQVYAGNQRVRAAKKLKWNTVPCVIRENLPEYLVRSRIIKDNKTYGEFDWEALANEYSPEELFKSGFTEEEIPDLSIEEILAEEEDSKCLDPVKDEDAVTKLGDVYDLTSGHLLHRVMCGDSTCPDTVQKVLNGHDPILMVTDPPYGVEYDASWRDVAGKGCRSKGKVQNDDQVNWALSWYLFPGSVAYVWHAGKYCAEVQRSLEEAEFEIISQIIWVKQHFALSRGDYHWQHEPCWYAVKKGHSHNWQGSRKEATTWEIANLNCFGKSKEDGEERTSHSTQKPIECMAKPIRNNTAKGEGVYDPFLGSGTTLIAAEQLGRNCYGIEISPAYVDICVDRWANYMKKNNKPYKINKNGEETHG